MYTDSLPEIRFESPVQLMACTKDSLWGIGANGDLMAMTEGRYGFPKVTTKAGANVISLGALQVGEEVVGGIVNEDGTWRLYYISPRFFRVLPIEGAPTHFRSFTGRDGNLVGITPDGDAYSFGLNEHGQLGVGSEADSFNFQKVELGDNVRVKAAAYGHDFLLVLSESGTVFSCGVNDHKQLMNGQAVDQNTARAISFRGRVEVIYAGYAQAYLKAFDAVGGESRTGPAS
jgi:hypothetical protein